MLGPSVAAPPSCARRTTRCSIPTLSRTPIGLLRHSPPSSARRTTRCSSIVIIITLPRTSNESLQHICALRTPYDRLQRHSGILIALHVNRLVAASSSSGSNCARHRARCSIIIIARVYCARLTTRCSTFPLFFPSFLFFRSVHANGREFFPRLVGIFSRCLWASAPPATQPSCSPSPAQTHALNLFTQPSPNTMAQPMRATNPGKSRQAV